MQPTEDDRNSNKITKAGRNMLYMLFLPYMSLYLGLLLENAHFEGGSCPVS